MKRNAVILRNSGMKSSNFKCFDEWSGFESIYPINLIVGRNNAGKSSVIDIVEHVLVGGRVDPKCKRKGKDPCFRSETRLTTEVIESLFDNSMRFEQLTGANLLAYMKQSLTGLRAVRFYQSPTQAHRFIPFRSDSNVEASNQNTRGCMNLLDPKLQNLFGTEPPPHFSRLRADRDILPESSEGEIAFIDERGTNATRIIEHCQNHGDRDKRRLLEDTMVKELNLIFEPDWSFKRIVVERVREQRDKWEVILEDRHEATMVPLRHAGSGIKTVLLVLESLHLVPAINSRNLGDLVFCFEEIENNLHPAAQRRLFQLLRDKAVETGCVFFITTHSNCVIDMFSHDSQAQLIHVTNDGDVASVHCVSTYMQRCRVLDDLDVRASDLLQANGVVWVEGPSDRLYFNRWIDLWSKGTLREYAHYQCVWYGGSLLADVTFAEPDRSRDSQPDYLAAFLNGLNVNRNAIVIMDSDRRAIVESLKERVQRIDQEITGLGGISWITAGREVENYLPVEALRLAFANPDILPIDQFESVPNAMASSSRKAELAQRVVGHVTREMLARDPHLSSMLDLVCERIRDWNGLS